MAKKVPVGLLAFLWWQAAEDIAAYEDKKILDFILRAGARMVKGPGCKPGATG